MKKPLIVAIISAFIVTLIIIIASSGDLFAHGKEKHLSKAIKGEITYTSNIVPVFNEKCAKCHGSKSPVHMEFIKDTNKYKKKMKGPRMDSYTHMVSFIIWPDTGSLMRALDDGKNTGAGNPGKMYRHLGKTEDERQKNLKLFKNWVGNWTLKEWPDITKEEINIMKLAF